MGEKMNYDLIVVYCVSNNYSRILGVSLLSLLKSNTIFKSIKIYILFTELHDDSILNLSSIVESYKRTCYFINILPLCNENRFWDEKMDCIFGRLLIPLLINEKALYLDSDLIVIDSLFDLWNTEVEGFSQLVVMDTVRKNAKHESGLNCDDRYFNSGVMLLNCKYWIENNLFEKMQKYEKSSNHKARYPDQRPLNAITSRVSFFVSPRYNLTPEFLHYTTYEINKIMSTNTFYSDSEIKNAIMQPAIIHFAGRSIDRPWYLNSTHYFTEIYRSLMKTTDYTNFELLKDNPLNVIKWKCKYIIPFRLQHLLIRLKSTMIC
jgi:lipopolysaccharide biosynthesis glycosyltransferase